MIIRYKTIIIIKTIIMIIKMILLLLQLLIIIILHLTPSGRESHSFLEVIQKKGRKKIFYLTIHSTYFIYSYRASRCLLNKLRDQGP